MKKIVFLISLCIALYVNAQWSLTGNAGTNPTQNFLGTTDASALILKTNNVERIHVANSGEIAIGGNLQKGVNFKVHGKSAFLHNADSDAFFIGNDLGNLDGGIDLAFLRYGAYQPNNPGVLTAAGHTSPGVYEVFFTLRSNGKLGLGTTNVDCTNCSGYRLLVKDGIKTEKVKVEIAAENGWADYVFDDDYKLLDLKSLEKFITENKHLPEVPTTEEVIQHGIELKEMNILLLKKVEELTLYLIDLNNEIEKLKRLK